MKREIDVSEGLFFTLSGIRHLANRPIVSERVEKILCAQIEFLQLENALLKKDYAKI